MKDYSVCPKCKCKNCLSVITDCDGAFMSPILSNGEIDYKNKEFVGETFPSDIFCTKCNSYISSWIIDEYCEFVEESEQEE